MSAEANLVFGAILDFAGADPATARVLDLGCGQGDLVKALCATGVDAYGCDVSPRWNGSNPRFKQIQLPEYRLPYKDNSFDLVYSMSVLEHAQNTRECFCEIKRVLKPGGVSFHMFPGKWYLPVEPHIYVPFVNMLWPRQPRWWLALWAIIGVRNEYQQGLGWRETVAANQRFCETSLCYRANSYLRDLSIEVFGNCGWPMDFFLSKGSGGMSRIYRKLPLKRPMAWISRHNRMACLVQRKPAQEIGAVAITPPEFASTYSLARLRNPA